MTRTLGPAILIAAVLAIGWSSPSRAGPTVFWASDPVAPGETVLVMGDGFAETTSVKVRRLADGIDADASAGDALEATVQRGSAESLTFTLPRDLKPGVFRATVETGAGTASLLVNAPTVYWTQADRGAAATAGGWIRVCGRNIGRAGTATLRLVDAAGATIPVTAKAAGLWDAAFDVPATVKPGRYRLELWNGNGDRTAVVAAGEVEILAPVAMTGASVTLPASTSDKTDDTRRINEALAAMAQTGGTVRLGRGQFIVTGTLNVPAKVELAGESADLTTVTLKDSLAPPAAVISGRGDFAVRDLSFDAITHKAIISGGFDGEQPAGDARNIVIDRVVIRASLYRGRVTDDLLRQRLAAAARPNGQGTEAVRLSGANVSLTNSDIVASAGSVILIGVENGVVRNNLLYNGKGGYHITRSQKVLFEDNTVTGADLESPGGGVSTLGKVGHAISQNILVKNNRFLRFFGWDREGLTTDGVGGSPIGAIAFCAGDTVAQRLGPPAADDRLPTYTRGLVYVLAGRGAGQVRRLISATPTSLTVDAPFAVDSDEETFAVLAHQQVNYLFVDNLFEDTGSAQLFGTSFNHVISGNTFIRSSGVRVRALLYASVQPVFSVQVLGNRMLSPVPGSETGVEVRTVPPAGFTAPMVRGVVIRGNDMLGAGRIDVRGTDNRDSGLVDVVIEHNRVERSRTGISVDRAGRRVLLRDNSFQDVQRPVINQSLP